MSNEILTINADKISKLTKYSPEEVAIVKNTVAKGTTDTELAFFLSLCRSVNLNPMNKEIWCYKDNKGNLITITGRDGFLKKAQESPRWNGMTSLCVYENDSFDVEVTEQKVTISHKPTFKNKGKLLGAYTLIRPKDCEQVTFEWAEFSTFDKGQFIWKSDPEGMIKKVSESHALKKAFGITGLQSEYDFEEVNGVAVPIQHKEVNELNEAKKKIIEALDKYVGDDTEIIKEMCIEKQEAGEFTMEFAKEIAIKIGVKL